MLLCHSVLWMSAPEVDFFIISIMDIFFCTVVAFFSILSMIQAVYCRKYEAEPINLSSPMCEGGWGADHGRAPTWSRQLTTNDKMEVKVLT